MIMMVMMMRERKERESTQTEGKLVLGKLGHLLRRGLAGRAAATPEWAIGRFDLAMNVPVVTDDDP